MYQNLIPWQTCWICGKFATVEFAFPQYTYKPNFERNTVWAQHITFWHLTFSRDFSLRATYPVYVRDTSTYFVNHLCKFMQIRIRHCVPLPVIHPPAVKPTLELRGSVYMRHVVLLWWWLFQDDTAVETKVCLNIYNIYTAVRCWNYRSSSIPQ